MARRETFLDTKVGTFTRALYDEAEKKGWIRYPVRELMALNRKASAVRKRVGPRTALKTF
jgi:hypothetical protein